MTFTITPSLIEELDKLEQSPSDLARKVWFELKGKCGELTNYELTCFCIEWLAGQSLTNMQYASEEIKQIAKLFYYAHYYRLSQKDE